MRKNFSENYQKCGLLVLKIFRQPCPRQKEVQELSTGRRAKFLVCYGPQTGLASALNERILLLLLLLLSIIRV
jgi:hypothetical protein